MAELGIVASALQIADLGIRLSLRLYTFGETVAGADKSIISISKEVSLTSTVLKELGQTLERDQTARICSPNAVQTAESIAKECRGIFEDMDQVLVKKFTNTKSAEKDRRIKAAQTLERLRWPFIKGKIGLLTSNLERQKSTLVLMLNVITLAKQEYERTEPYTMIAEQRSLIQDLARSNEDYTRKFEQLRLSCDSVPVHPEPILADCNNTMPTPKVPTPQGWAGVSAVDAARQREPSTGARGLGPGPYMGSRYSHGPDTSLPDDLSWLQQQYRKLLSALLMEVSAPSYEIADDSRSRIKAEIVTIHIREMEHMEQIQYPRPASLARPIAGPLQQMQAQQCSYSSLMPNQQMQGHQQHSYSSLTPNQPMQIQQIQTQQQSRMRNQQMQAQQQSFNGPIPIEQMQAAQQSLNSQMPTQQMQGQQQNCNKPMSVQQIQALQQSSIRPMQMMRESYQSHWMKNGISQDATYNSPSAMAISATSHSTCGEHEQHSAAQSQPSMPSMIGALPPQGGHYFRGLQRLQQAQQAHSAMVPMAGFLPVTSRTDSSGINPRATILHSGQRQSLSKPQPGISVASPHETLQSPSPPRSYALLDPAKAIDQESSIYGKSDSESDQRRPEPQGVGVQCGVPHFASRTSGGRKRKLDSTSLSDHTPVTEDTKTSKVGASGEIHLATSCEDSGNEKASEDNAVYSRDAISCNAHRGSSLERILENHTPEDWAENVVDELLAAWTTLPVSAIRTASQHGSFAVVAV